MQETSQTQFHNICVYTLYRVFIRGSSECISHVLVSLSLSLSLCVCVYVSVCIGMYGMSVHNTGGGAGSERSLVREDI